MAAQDLERLVVQLSADIKKYENALSRASGVTNRRARAIEARFEKMNRTLKSAAADVAVGFGKAFAVIGGVQGMKNLSDSATRVDNALKVAGLSGEDLERTYQSLFASAIKNAAPIETLVNLYSRLSLVQGELGVSQEEIKNFTDGIAVALRAGGTSAQEAAGALTQLTQALGGGIVRAEEFSSLIEGAPTILQAAAAGIKEAEGSVAKLRQIMLDGELSSRALFDGFQAGSAILETRVASSVLTIDQRLTNLNTSLINAAREFNSSAKAGETFGNEIDRIAKFVSSIDFNNLISQIQGVVGAMNSGIAAANSFAQSLGNLSGFDIAGSSLVNALGGKNGKVSFFGGALTIGATRAAAEQNTLADKRLSIEKQIAALKAQPINPEIERTIAKLQAQLPQVKADLATVAPKVEGGALIYDRFTPPGSSTVKPISIAEDTYAVPAQSKKGAGGKGRSRSSTDDLQREIQQIKDRTLALQGETEAQAGLNPLVNDYGFAVEKAAAKHDLLTAAQQAGKTVTPELAAEIDGLATAYANAVVASEKLAESQDKIRQRAEEAREFNKDLTRGIVDGFIQGKDAADLFADALGKIGDRLLDLAFDSVFKSPSSGGFDLGGLFKGLFREKGGPVKAGQPYIVGEKRPELFVPNQSGRIIPQVPSAPKLPSVTGRSASSASSFTYAPTIDARGADVEAVARLERAMAKDRAELPKKVVKAVQEAQKRNVNV